MKRALLWAGITTIVTCYLSCMYRHHGSTSIKIRETRSFYSMEAYFDKNKTRKVQQFMNSELGDRNSVSFINTRTDAMITLDDRTTFYMKSNPGELKIKLNKQDNSFESYTEIKDLCEGLKEIIGGK
jgi:hypothetical protein